LLVLALLALLLMGKGDLPATPLTAVSPGYGSTEAVGGLIFSAGIVPFELATALLIVAVVGAIAVARSRHAKKKPSTEDNETKRLFAGPLHPRDAQHPLSKEAAE
jgi:hypothetical protein